MSDNVIILGAGFSFDAGVPLLRQFVDRMWEISTRGRLNGRQLSENDRGVFSRALKVREVLDSYHGRANFDDRNLEDILSLLSFSILSGDPAGREQLNAVIQALARTIELTCNVTHPGFSPDGRYHVIETGAAVYRSFWLSLFRWHQKSGSFPTIVTFNYDLVLERSLLQTLIGPALCDAEVELPFHHLRVRYHFPSVKEELWEVKRTGFEFHSEPEGYRRRAGYLLLSSSADASDSMLDLELLKLHGSLNFPRGNCDPVSFNITAPLEDPYILPPIFNKLSSDTPADMWKVAMTRLSQAKNVIFVGYSLPDTDIYMQYFLKASLGPNKNLNRVHVIDPALATVDAAKLKQRYENCFAPQLRSRLDFHGFGTDQFVQTLSGAPDTFLF